MLCIGAGGVWYPVEMHVFHISNILCVGASGCRRLFVPPTEPEPGKPCPNGQKDRSSGHH